MPSTFPRPIPPWAAWEPPRPPAAVRIPTRSVQTRTTALRRLDRETQRARSLFLAQFIRRRGWSLRRFLSSPLLLMVLIVAALIHLPLQLLPGPAPREARWFLIASFALGPLAAVVIAGEVTLHIARLRHLNLFDTLLLAPFTGRELVRAFAQAPIRRHTAFWIAVALTLQGHAFRLDPATQRVGGLLVLLNALNLWLTCRFCVAVALRAGLLRTEPLQVFLRALGLLVLLPALAGAALAVLLLGSNLVAFVAAIPVLWAIAKVVIAQRHLGVMRRQFHRICRVAGGE